MFDELFLGETLLNVSDDLVIQAYTITNSYPASNTYFITFWVGKLNDDPNFLECRVYDIKTLASVEVVGGRKIDIETILNDIFVNNTLITYDIFGNVTGHFSDEVQSLRLVPLLNSIQEIEAVELYFKSGLTHVQAFELDVTVFDKDVMGIFDGTSDYI